jgi:hypothetical protein
MSFKEQIESTIQKVEIQKLDAEKELAELEEEFANVKLNPYGITSIDFGKRQELSTDVIKMEGAIMGLKLALETYAEVVEGAAT